MKNAGLLFDVVKTIQVAARLLQRSDGKMKHWRLLNLLYLINRKSLEINASFVVLDRACALTKGPILSTVYNLVHSRDSQYNVWQGPSLYPWRHCSCLRTTRSQTL